MLKERNKLKTKPQPPQKYVLNSLSMERLKDFHIDNETTRTDGANQ